MASTPWLAYVCWHSDLVSNIADEYFRPHSYRHQEGVKNLPTTPHLCRQGLGARFDILLQAIQIHQALPSARRGYCNCTFNPISLTVTSNNISGQGNPPISRRAQEARWSLRMHPLRLLLDLLPIVLVEQQRIPRPRSSARVIPLVGRLA